MNIKKLQLILGNGESLLSQSIQYSKVWQTEITRTPVPKLCPTGSFPPWRPHSSSAHRLPEIQCDRVSIKTTLKHSHDVCILAQDLTFFLCSWPQKWNPFCFQTEPTSQEEGSLSPTIVPQSCMPPEHMAPERHILLTT